MPLPPDHPAVVNLRASFAALSPDARSAVRAALRSAATNPDLPKQVAGAVGHLLAFMERAKVVGTHVALAEVDDRDARMAIARTLAEVARKGASS